MSDESYDFEIGEEGQKGLDLLGVLFNPTTKSFIKQYGLQEGMKVLDVGCGTGDMSRWFARQVGLQGRVLAIDNNENQIHAAKVKTPDEGNIEYKCLSAYDILQLKETFDLVYCRFVLHHLHSPRQTIQLFYEVLNAGGIYIGEEGLINAAFAYPATFAWEGYMPEMKAPSEEKDGLGRDGDFGMKLFYYTKQAGFAILSCQLVHPLLWKKEQKEPLLIGLQEFKKTALAQGMTEEEWQQKYQETQRIALDDNQILGFYESCQIAAKKT